MMAGHVTPLLLLMVLGLTSGGRVLMLPYSVFSHARQLLSIAEAFEANGHEVYIAFAPKFAEKHNFKETKVKILLHKHFVDDVTSVPIERVVKIITDMTEKKDFISSVRENLPEWGNVCVNQLMDDTHYQKLKELNFDIAIVDVFPMSRCLLPIPYSLGIPYIGFETQYEPWLMGTPTLPSFVPSNNLAGAYTPKMNFWERFHNLWMHIDWFGFPGTLYNEDDFINKYVRDNKPYITMNQLFGGCSLFLTDVDVVLDYPRPRLPNEIQVGGLTVMAAKPLTWELQEFMNGATDGVIIVSFGSYTYNFGDELLAEYMSAFSQLKQMIIWKYHMVPKSLSKNVKVLPWFSQNDLLAHPNTKIFITHCGSNGQFEALYHAVPMVGYPLFGDQLYNCKRIEYHGYGRCLDSTNFKASHLVDAINDVLGNGSYQENIQFASEMFRDKPMTSLESIIYWTEHVMKFGSAHLRSHGQDMPWYQYWMVDVIVFAMVVVTFGLMLVATLLYLLVQYLATPRHVKLD